MNAAKSREIDSFYCRIWIPTIIFILFLAACEKSTVDVNLSGVNYTKDAFTYIVSDVANPRVGSGGGLIDPFASGGITCCVSLPKKWRPGIKLHIRTTHWVEGGPEKKIQEVKGEQIVDVSAYVDDKPGDLWVIREMDGKFTVISSDFQPNHPKWPGKVKGWPVPSLEYRRQRWEQYKKHQQMFVETYQELLDELKNSPDAHADGSWRHAMEYNKKSLRGFSGPKDPDYRDFLKKNYTEALENSRNELEKVMKGQP